MQAMADDPVHHHWNPEIALLGGTWFRNLYPPCGFETTLILDSRVVAFEDRVY
jgi:hypothetical protein